MQLLEKFATLRLERTVDYLNRAEYVRKQLEHAGEKVSEYMVTEYFNSSWEFAFRVGLFQNCARFFER